MQGSNNNDASRDKWNFSLRKQNPLNLGNNGIWNQSDVPLSSPFYATSPSIYSPYVCGTPLLPNGASFFGPSFEAALESTIDRPINFSSSSFQNKSGSDINSLPMRDICSETNEACFFGAGFSSSVESFSNSRPSSFIRNNHPSFRKCASPFIYYPCYSEDPLAQNNGAFGADSDFTNPRQSFPLNTFAKSSLESFCTKPEINQTLKCQCRAISPETNTAKELSRKVFIGGVPAGTNQSILVKNFSKFGSVKVDWPKKTVESGVPPEGYVFAIYEDEHSVSELLSNCLTKGKRLIFHLEISPARKAPVEIKAWNVNNAVYIGNHGWRRFRTLSVFAGGLPRTCTAEFLAKAVEEVIGPVAYCTIEQDKFTRYPKGAAQIVFSLKESYMVAIDAHEIYLNFPEGSRKIELKPFLSPNVPCAGCGIKSNTRFCKALICLAYYCEGCWKEKHNSAVGMVSHEASRKIQGKKNGV